MNAPASAQYNWRHEKSDGLEFVVLSCEASPNAAGKLDAWIAPSWGSNLCRLSVDGMNVIDFDPGLVGVDFTGTPVLYPTPNRVRSGVFRHEGKDYPQVQRGKTIYEHGLVHSEPWMCQEPVVEDDSVRLATWIDFDPQSDCFEAFPFRHRLWVEFRLTCSGIQVTFKIENMDTQPIPYGFGLHPYFRKLGGALVVLPADCVMEATSDLLPTGRLIAVAGTRYDLRKPTPIGQLDLDHVFTGVPEGKFARILYPNLNLCVRLVATQEFSHLVLYTPQEESYFCLENQSCSTDAHKLYDRGFRTESGLRFVPTGGTHTGSVTYDLIRGACDEN
jgi:aldose 1-epimerase